MSHPLRVVGARKANTETVAEIVRRGFRIHLFGLVMVSHNNLGPRATRGLRRAEFNCLIRLGAR
ncbi:MAG TPA: hypothetical protein DHV80_02035 [Acidimicrobiaceae bacterium]|nr:hypothetical protein [Acidimicrobiaceae bacterium]HCJ85309.1 hypothetical protein [Acidimicrobiaceae bacterium]